MVGGQAVDELARPARDLEGEVGRRRPDEGVDVVACRLAIHAGESLALGSRGAPIEPVRATLMLLGTVLLWALNATVTRYVLTHGFQPLAYATIRYARATILFWGFTYARERSFRIALRDMRLVLLAALFIYLQPALLHLCGRQDLGGDGDAVPRQRRRSSSACSRA